MRTADVNNWIGTSTINALAFDSNANVTYLAGTNGVFGYINSSLVNEPPIANVTVITPNVINGTDLIYLNGTCSSVDTNVTSCGFKRRSGAANPDLAGTLSPAVGINFSCTANTTLLKGLANYSLWCYDGAYNVTSSNFSMVTRADAVVGTSEQITSINFTANGTSPLVWMRRLITIDNTGTGAQAWNYPNYTNTLPTGTSAWKTCAGNTTTTTCTAINSSTGTSAIFRLNASAGLTNYTTLFYNYTAGTINFSRTGWIFDTANESNQTFNATMTITEAVNEDVNFSYNLTASIPGYTSAINISQTNITANGLTSILARAWGDWFPNPTESLYSQDLSGTHTGARSDFNGSYNWSSLATLPATVNLSYALPATPTLGGTCSGSAWITATTGTILNFTNASAYRLNTSAYADCINNADFSNFKQKGTAAEAWQVINKTALWISNWTGSLVADWSVANDTSTCWINQTINGTSIIATGAGTTLEANMSGDCINESSFGSYYTIGTPTEQSQSVQSNRTSTNLDTDYAWTGVAWTASAEGTPCWLTGLQQLSGTYNLSTTATQLANQSGDCINESAFTNWFQNLSANSTYADVYIAKNRTVQNLDSYQFENLTNTTSNYSASCLAAQSLENNYTLAASATVTQWVSMSGDCVNETNATFNNNINTTLQDYIRTTDTLLYLYGTQNVSNLLPGVNLYNIFISWLDDNVDIGFAQNRSAFAIDILQNGVNTTSPQFRVNISVNDTQLASNFSWTGKKYAKKIQISDDPYNRTATVNFAYPNEWISTTLYRCTSGTCNESASGDWTSVYTTYASGETRRSGDTLSNLTYLLSYDALYITLIYPFQNNIQLSGTVNFQYNVSTITSAQCNLTVNSIVRSAASVSSNTTVTSTVNFENGNYTWNVTCNNETSETRKFKVIEVGIPDAITLNITNATEAIQEENQMIFYDSDGILNILYFTNTSGTYQLNVYKANAAETNMSKNYTSAMNVTKPFWIAFKDYNTTLLTFDNSSNLSYFMDYNGALVINSTGSIYNVTSNSYYNPYQYMNTKVFPSLNISVLESYWLFLLPLQNETKLMRKNINSQILIDTGESTNLSAGWQTMPKLSSLKEWYYVLPTPYDENNSVYTLYTYNGLVSSSLGNITGVYPNSVINASSVYFDEYDDMMYIIIGGLNSTIFIYQYPTGKTATINVNLRNPSEMLFIDSDTFILPFNSSVQGCYFGGTAAQCSLVTNSDYGLQLLSGRGYMATSKRESINDTVATGLILPVEGTKLAYGKKAYDVKFDCYDEKDEFRKNFTVRIFTNTSSTVLRNNLMGYVIPSSSLGSGDRKVNSLCSNGTNRLYILGVQGNFLQDMFSLNTWQGAFYIYTVKNQYNQPIGDVTITAYRFIDFKQAWTTVEQTITNPDGVGTLFLEPQNQYRIVVEKDGFVTSNFDFIPTQVTSIALTLFSEGAGVNITTSFENIFKDVSWQLLPNNQSHFAGSFNITYQITSSEAKLQYWGMSINKEWNGTNTLVYSNNQSSSPPGGAIQYEATAMGKYHIRIWFKHQDYPEYRSTTLSAGDYSLGNVSSLTLASGNIQNILSGWGYYFLALVLAMMAALFTSQYTVDGAGVVGLIILWGFTIFNPMACVVGLISGVCLTPMLMTLLTTAFVGAALYLKNPV